MWTWYIRLMVRIIILCLYACVLVYVPGPRRFPLSCILKFALRLFDWTAALSPQRLSFIFCPLSSQDVSFCFSFFLFSLSLVLFVGSCLCPSIYFIEESTWTCTWLHLSDFIMPYKPPCILHSLASLLFIYSQPPWEHFLSSSVSTCMYIIIS